MIGQDPNNLLTQAGKAHAADPSQGGDMAAALARITAKAFVYAFAGDVMFPPQDCKLDAERIPGARFRQLATRYPGHLTTFGLFPEDKTRSMTPFAKARDLRRCRYIGGQAVVGLTCTT